MKLSREEIIRMVGDRGGSSQGGGGNAELSGVASMAWVNETFLGIDYFNQLFETTVRVVVTDISTTPATILSNTTRVLAPNEVAVPSATTTDPDTGHTIVTTMTITGIQVKTGLWSNSYLSALGQNSGGGGGGVTLNEPLSSINMAGLSAPGAAQDGQTVVWDNATGKWKYGAAGGGAYLPLTGGTMANTNLVTNMNADLLDGWHITSIINTGTFDFDNTDPVRGYILHADTESTHTPSSICGGNQFTVIQVLPSNTNWGAQLAIGFGSPYLAWRNRQGTTTWSDWQKIKAGDADAATKLQTARTLWGQSFDGTANVSGSLSNTGHITSSTHKTYNIGTSTNMYNSIFGKWVGAGANEAFSMGANNDYAIYINTTQNVGIGKAVPAYKLDVNGNTFVNGILYIGQNYGIEAYNSAGLLVYKPASGWTGVDSGQWAVGSIDAQGVIRSGGSDLLHYRNGTYYTIVTTRHYPGRSYNFSVNTDLTNGMWHRLGNYKTAGDDKNFVIMLYSGSGYNAYASQNSFARIVVKDGWQVTSSVGPANSVGITVERFGNFDSSHEIKALAVATSNTEGELWVYLPWQYANGDYTISGVYDSWTHNAGYADDTTIEPSSNQRDTGYFDNIYNTNIHGTITGHLIPGTNNAYDIGSSSYFLRATYTKKIYLASGIYFELDANNHVHLVGAGFYSDSFVSALGLNDEGGGGGSEYLYGLIDVNINNPTNGQALVYNATSQKWENQTIGGGGSGTLSSIGLVMPTGFNVSPGTLTSNGSFTVSFANGYALPTTEDVGKGVTAYGWGNHAIAGYWKNGTGNHPTTLSNYGITDAVASSTTWWGQSISRGAVSGSIEAGNSGGHLGGFDHIDLNTHGSLSNYGGYVDFYFNGANAYTSRIIENASGTLSVNGVTMRNGYVTASRYYLSSGVYFELSNGNVHLVGAGFYTDSFVSALGLNSGGGGGGAVGDVTWDALADSTDTRQIAASHLSTALGSYSGNVSINGTLNVGDPVTLGDVLTVNDEIFMNTNEKVATQYWVGQNYLPLTGGTLSSNLYIDGNLYIHDTNPGTGEGFYWTIDGNGYSVLTIGGGTTVAFSCGVTAPSFTQTSDQRKKDIIDYDALISLSAIANAPAIHYTWKEGIDKDVHVGTMAQYWRDICPEAVPEGYDGMYGIQYDVLAMLNTISIAKTVTDHEQRIADLETENNRLRKEIEQLKAS